MEHGSEPAVLPQLLQDEDVRGYWGHPHELWSGAECLQSLVSDSRYKSLAVSLHHFGSRTYSMVLHQCQASTCADKIEFVCLMGKYSIYEYSVHCD